MAPTTPTYVLADHIFDGGLARKLKGWRSDHRSYEWIARELYNLTDGKVDVTYGTVRNWLVSEETAA